MEPDRFTETTVDTALGGLVSVCQPAKGFRFSVDALLLARFASANVVVEAVELGCGCGVVGFCLLNLSACQRLRGIEVQPAFVELAKRGAELNSLTERAFFESCDVRQAVAKLGRASAQLVVMNPPYRPVSSSKVSPDTSISIAKFEVLGQLSDFTECGADILTRGGELCAVYPASRVDHLFACMVKSGLSPHRVRFIHPRLGDPASLVMVGAVKGGRGALKVESPLFLHDSRESGRKYSEEAANLLGCSGG